MTVDNTADFQITLKYCEH